MTPPTGQDLHGSSAAARRRLIVDVFRENFGELAASDPEAFRVKFRKMAATAFAFYRGSACLFYADIAGRHDAFLSERTSRIWIQGDLHAENFGTYMNSEGEIVFDVNDFDEAYVGPFTWDIRRLVASLALLGYEKALSDDEIRQMVETYVRSYIAQIKAFNVTSADHGFALTRDNTSGALHELLLAVCERTRVGMLERSTTVESHQRRFVHAGHTRPVEAEERRLVIEAFDRYRSTIPASKQGETPVGSVKDVVARYGVGIGSAGLPSYNLLIGGATQALETDVLLYMKTATPAAPSRFVTDAAISGYFEHEGHRTVVSQRALQAHADPRLGHTVLRGAGQVVAEVSPYTVDLVWDEINRTEDILELLEYLGRATAKIHCVSDADSDQTLVPFHTEDALHAALGGREEEFVKEMVEFAEEYGCQARDDHRLFVDAFRNRELVF